MLKQPTPKKQPLTPSPLTLILILIILNDTNCQMVLNHVISDVLGCESEVKVYRIQGLGDGGNAGKEWMVKLDIGTDWGLPVGLAVWNRVSDVSTFDRYSLITNKNIDTNSIQLAKKQQVLYYLPGFNQSEFVVGVVRADLSKFNYVTNVDRTIQDYTGTNPDSLTKCTVQIPYKITLYTFPPSSQPQPQPVLQFPPISPTQCPTPSTFTFQSKPCQCPQNHGMQLCEAEFIRLTEFDKVTKKYLVAGGRSYFYFQPKEEMFQGKDFVGVGVEVKGAASGKFRYDGEDMMKDFVVLWTVTSISDPLRIASYFNQMNPASISSITLQKTQRLLLTIHKPQSSPGQSFQISLFQGDPYFTQILTIIISVTSSTTILIVIIFIIYLIHQKKRRDQQLMMVDSGAAVPVPMRGRNKVVNFGEKIEEVFPGVLFGVLWRGLRDGVGVEVGDGGCVICLEGFGDDSVVRCTDCLHVFHDKCLVEWLFRQPTCPLCRHQLLFYSAENPSITPINRYLKLWQTHKLPKTSQNPLQMQSSHNIRAQPPTIILC